MTLFYFLVGYGTVLVLTTFVPPSIGFVYFLGFVIGFSMGGYFVVPDAILGDCIDYDEFHTGMRSESGYTVIETNLQQFMEVPAYALPLTIVGLAGYLGNGGCGCGCGQGDIAGSEYGDLAGGSCIYAPLPVNASDPGSALEWQSALIVAEDKDVYAQAYAPDADIRTRLNLGDTDGLIPFPSYNFSGPQRGSFLGSCQAIAAADAPCSLSGADAFTGDDSDFGSSMCAYTEQSTGPEAFCTYQPTAVYYWFKFFLGAFPGMCALLAAYPTYCKRHHFPQGVSKSRLFTVDSCAADYPLEREQHGKVTEGIAAHNEGRSATDPLTGVEVPAPAGADRETKDRLAAYDHYSDDELRAAAAMSSAESAAAVSRNPLSIAFVAF